jgi:hypothetical protein
MKVFKWSSRPSSVIISSILAPSNAEVQLRFIRGCVFAHDLRQVVDPKKLMRIRGAFRPIKLFRCKPIRLLRQRRASSPEFHFTEFRSCLLSLGVSEKAFSYRYNHRNLSADAILLVDDVSNASFVLASLADSFDVFSVRLIVTSSKRSFFRIVALDY